MKKCVMLFWSGVLGIAACNRPDTQQTIAAPSAAQAPKIMAPFRYQKTIEVAPGKYYDVLAWGRGSETMGAFEILRSDSSSMKYTTTTGDLEGKIVDAMNSDMDTDGNPEIFIHTQAADSTNAAKIFAFEYNDDKARQLDFPKLTRSQRKGYRGNDNFFVKDGSLMREFDVYDENDTLAKKPIQKRLIQYSLRGNSISAEQISKDSTSTTSAAAVPVKKESSSSSNNSSTRSSSSSRNERSSSSRRHSTSHSSSTKERSKRSSKKETSKKKRRRH